MLQPQATSFETVPSARVSSVFTTADEGDDLCTSNNTSIMTSPADDTQNLFPTQEYQELMDDEEFSTSFAEACASTSAVDPLDLMHNTPFKRSALLPSNVPFWYSWEIHRVASSLGRVPIDVYEAVRKRPGQHNPNTCYDDIWKVIRQICQEIGGKPMVAKSELSSWTTVQNQYEDPQLNKVVYLTGSLEWNIDPSQGLFDLHLNEIHLEQACRLHRKFGADRFLVISIPDFSTCPKQSRQLDEETFHERITDFLAAGPHYIAGRYWRAFWIEQEKIKTKKKKKIQGTPRQKIHMFAEQGYDMVKRMMKNLNVNVPDLRVNGRHQELTLKDIMEWHMPIQENVNSTDLKLFSRWSIALSKTTPTIVLERDEFLYLPDPPGKVVMNDGCSRMSYALAKDIWAKCGGEGPVPSAVQGRIGGAKGLWIVDYTDTNTFCGGGNRHYWIEVSDSQLKIKPHPRDRVDADENQRIFEVLKFAGECRTAHLNIQLITALEDRGVPRITLQALLEDDTSTYAESLKAAMSDPRALRLWMQDYGLASRPKVESLLGSFPIDHREQIKLLLESGFHPQECPRVKELASGFLKDYMTNYVEKLWIHVPHSTVAFCVPDPLGVLEEDEVCINFSLPVKDPRKDYEDTILDGLDVLVARNPAYLASDIQVRRAVYKHELRHYKNVILFPVKGKQPLAALLSGGDYDGDTVTVIWDPVIVQGFQNTLPPQLPKEKDCGMVQESRPMSFIFNSTRTPDQAMQEFLRGCISFNARPSLMGVCSSEHEKLIYALSQKGESDKLSNKGAIKLGALAAYLVDSNKQGWSLPRKAFYLRREVSGPKRLPDPSFRGETAPRRILDTYPNAIDFLKFEVAENCKRRELGRFDKLPLNTQPYDRSLSEIWNKAMEEAEQGIKSGLSGVKSATASRLRKDQRVLKNMPHAAEQPAPATLNDLLQGPGGLLEQIDEVREMAAKLAVIPQITGSTPANPTDRKRFSIAVQAVYERFQSIEPKPGAHELRRRFEDERDQGHPFAHWSLLRASCLHRRACGRGRFPNWVWYVAGKELCILKTLHQGREVRMVTAGMYNILKIDSKFTRGLLEGSVAEADTSFSYYDAVDEPEMSDDDDEDS